MVQLAREARCRSSLPNDPVLNRSIRTDLLIVPIVYKEYLTLNLRDLLFILLEKLSLFAFNMQYREEFACYTNWPLSFSPTVAYAAVQNQTLLHESDKFRWALQPAHAMRALLSL